MLVDLRPLTGSELHSYGLGMVGDRVGERSQGRAGLPVLVALTAVLALSRTA